MDRSDSAEESSRPIGWVLWGLLGLAAGVFACWLLWWGGEQLDRAAALGGSTFDWPAREVAQAQLLFIAAGVLFAVVALLSRNRARRSHVALLVAAAIPPIGLLLVVWDNLGPGLSPDSLADRMRWAVGWDTQAAAAVAAAVLVTTLVWRLVDRARATEDVVA